MIAKSIFNIEDEAISNDKDCFDTYGKGIDFAKADKLNNLGKMLHPIEYSKFTTDMAANLSWSNSRLNYWTKVE